MIEPTVPRLVEQAYAVARQLGFPLTTEQAAGRPSACLPSVGRFLAMLAAGCHGGVIAEFGTGAGISAAWIASAMPGDCTLVTADLDSGLVAAAAGLFAGDARVRVLSGDANDVLPPHAPFDLIFADCGVRDAGSFAALCAMLQPGGRIVMDDLTPTRSLPAHSPLRASDVKRDLFAGQDRLTWTEVVLPDLANSLLVGTRR
ncbi:MAG TPA: class I SAM-dependent methyltransferase [Streptosporangiaceae bacterium]|nr:class I SAM-dependent methyltransferase [Streptosporangiaceae bacterium]